MTLRELAKLHRSAITQAYQTYRFILKHENVHKVTDGRVINWPPAEVEFDYETMQKALDIRTNELLREKGIVR